MAPVCQSNQYRARYEGTLDVRLVLENKLWNISILDLTNAPSRPTPFFPGPKDLETAKRWALSLAQGYILDNEIPVRPPEKLSWNPVDSD